MATLDGLKQTVQEKFSEIRGALHMREKLLLRQIEVIAQQQLGCGSCEKTGAKSEAEVKFLVEQENELLAAIRSFGRFQLDNMNLALNDIYLKHEDYITPSNDHETMYKCLQQVASVKDLGLEEELAQEQPEAIVVDFSKNKTLMEHNRQHMNESIINITLQEAKELIHKAKVKREMPIPPLNLEELDDELESSIAEAVSSLGGQESPVNTKSSQTFMEAVAKKAKKSRFKPKITINNCNGTINLRNISSLTINCAAEESVSADIPVQQQTPVEERDEAATDTTSQCSKSSKCTLKSKKSTHTLKHAAATNQQATVTVETSSTGTSTPTTTATSNSNYSSNCSSRSQSKKQKSSIKNSQDKNAVSNSEPLSANAQPSSSAAYVYDIVDDVDEDSTTAVTCDFYNRLLNEIKNSLKEKTKRTNDTIWITSSSGEPARTTDSTSAENSADTNCTTASTSSAPAPQPGKRLILKNFENLKIILEANSDEETFHPVQIEQWLAEIISETDLEPMQNTDILEHSKIHNETA